MESLYNEAASLLMERFPKLGILLGTWEKKPIIEEKYSEANLDSIDLLYVYGLGSGSIFFQLESWLMKDSKKRVVFLEDEPGIIASFLSTPAAPTILRSTQVHLDLFAKKDHELQLLSEMFPMQKIELISAASKRGAKELRLKLLRKTALSHSLHLDRFHGHYHFFNFLKNVAHLPNSFYANGLKGSFKDVPAVVCGAGPSLQGSIETLRTLEDKALIIAGGSTLAALSSQGIMPHFAMAVDPNEEEFRRLKNSFAFEVPFLYSTRVHPQVFQTCNGPFGYMRSGVGGIVELWLEEQLGLTEPLLGEFLSAEVMSVTGMCVAWAQYLGCNPILLDGIDMAYTNNCRYAAGVTEETSIPEKCNGDLLMKKKGRQGKLVTTAVRWVMESAAISHFAKKHPEVRFINTTTGGLGFKGIEFIPIDEVVVDFKSQSFRQKVTEALLKAPMPAHEIINNKIEELKQSLNRVIEHLRILTHEKSGSSALAEFEIMEELATDLLFYDIAQLYKKDDQFWQNWKAHALAYTVPYS